ncbi:MAG: ATP-binding protein [Gammaproteobacteria bacterium]|nr:ATP-binding protein [Gammaproteobacteria bacterium]
MASGKIIPRLVEPRLVEALDDSPAVLIHGPRQSGKTTLAQIVGKKRGYRYFNLDDDVLRGAAEDDPMGFVGDLPDRVILDEVQRVPALFTALKSAIDSDRSLGRFLLTGSANVLLVPKLADSLAGRMEIIRLFPFAQCELDKKESTFLDALFSGNFKINKYERLQQKLPQCIVAGGYPAALARNTPRRSAAWYRDYVDAIVQRDVRDLARIASLDVLPRLLTLIGRQTSRLLNISELAGPFQISRPTIRDYVTLLEKVFLVDELPPWHTNRLSRLVKTPKLHIGDTGLAAALLGVNAQDLAADRELLGQFLETFVYQELRRQSSGHEDDIRFHHFRDKDGYEVDLVLEKGTRQVAGVEVKAAASVSSSDFRGLRKLASAAGNRFAAGVILYDGDISVSFGDSLYAVPIRRLWEAG